MSPTLVRDISVFGGAKLVSKANMGAEFGAYGERGMKVGNRTPKCQMAEGELRWTEKSEDE
jgi:hypothetical protein